MFESGSDCNYQVQYIRDRNALPITRDYMAEAEAKYRQAASASGAQATSQRPREDSRSDLSLANERARRSGCAEPSSRWPAMPSRAGDRPASADASASSLRE